MVVRWKPSRQANRALSGGAVVLAGLLAIVGCESKQPPAPSAPSSSGAEHDHGDPDHGDHDHGDHDHADAKSSGTTKSAEKHSHDEHETGPNGGHLVHLEPLGLHAEYVHVDQEELIEVFALDRAGDAKACRMKLEVQGQEPKVFEFEPIAEKPGGFRLKSGELLTGLKMSGQGVAVSLELEVGDQQVRSVVEHHEH
jgi:hypothetical protein